jgi:exodeoxyribonuclease VII large subunit
LQYEQLRAKLESEGLFDESRKRKLPRIPRRIGVVTSPTGAVIRDIINVTRRRFPLTELVVFPTLVQGDDAPDQICKAIQTANGRQDLDLIIVARGGGSLEDLWCFNDERVARAIFASRLPVISAIGHETDVTISDLVADFRAPTPSAAAEQAVPDQLVLRSEISSLVRRLETMAEDEILNGRRHVKTEVDVLERYSPKRAIEQLRQALDSADERLINLATRRIGLERERLTGRQLQLVALSPLRVLTRGFSLVTRSDTGELVRSVASVRPGDRVSVRVADGTFGGRVED